MARSQKNPQSPVTCSANCKLKLPIGPVSSPPTNKFGPIMVETQLPHTSAFRNADFQSAVSQISNLPVTINTMRDKLLWPLPPADFSLAPNEIHVWAASLDVTPAHLAALVLTLAPDEQARAARFHFARDRNRFRAGRGL